MRLIIAGSRDFDNYALLLRAADQFIAQHLPLSTDNRNPADVEIVSGCARGADTLGERFGTELGCVVVRMPADWQTHGKAAGFIRNEQMAQYGTHLLAFWDGRSRGTEHMIDAATRKGLTVKIIRYEYY